jgi:regulator of protease activity HflC (stomatin/prohibitin superfamily)
MPADLNDYFNKNKKTENKGLKMPDKNPLDNMGKKGTFALYAIIAIILIALFAKPFVVIHSGEVGIKATAGKYEPIPLEPGVHFYVPMIQNVIVVDTRVRIINYTSNYDRRSVSKDRMGVNYANTISVLDARGLPVAIDLTVQYQLNPLNAPQTIAAWGLSWEEKIINPVVRDIVRNVVGKYTAEELPVNRGKIAGEIVTQVTSKIDSLKGAPVALEAIQLRNIILPQKIKDQIERVQIAKQEAQRTQYEVERAQQQAEKKKALAKGEADAKKIQAQGIADAKRIESDAEAYANKIIANSLTAPLIELRQIEVQGKFNDALKENRDAKLFLMPGGAVPNLWIDTKEKKAAASR